MSSSIAFVPSDQSVLYERFGRNEKENSWMIKVPNATYDVKITLGNFEVGSDNYLQVNGKSPKELPAFIPKAYTRDVSLLVPVTNKQIVVTARCNEEDVTKCKKSLTTVVAVQITTSKESSGAAEEEDTPRVELSYNSAMGGGCMSRPVGCVFEKEQVALIACPGYMILIPGTVKEKDVACKHKCIKKFYKDDNDCRANCPLKCTLDFKCTEEGT